MKTILFALFILVSGIKQTHAIPPPDFIIHVTSQLGVYFAMGAAFFSIIFGTSFIFLKSFYLKNKGPVIIILILLICNGGILYFNMLEEEKKENMIKELELKDYNINRWLIYKDEKLYNEYKELSYEEKVEKLLHIERVELEKWLFDKKTNSYNGESISNKDFESVLTLNSKNYTILDARENIEYEIGNIPGSIHHRVADIKTDNHWERLPKDTIIIVICRSGIRGELVSEYLLSKGLKAVYLEEGVKGWTEYGGVFNGVIELDDVFKDSKQSKYLSEAQFLENMNQGTKIIDARETTRLDEGNILKYSDNVSIMYNTSNYLNKKFEKYTEKDKIIVVCDDYVNCFDAKLIGLELEKRGVELVGIFAKKGVVK